MFSWGFVCRIFCTLLLVSVNKTQSQFGNHNTKHIMIICIIPTSPKIVYRDSRDRCVTDYRVTLALPAQLVNNYTLSMLAQVKFTEKTADNSSRIPHQYGWCWSGS